MTVSFSLSASAQIRVNFQKVGTDRSELNDHFHAASVYRIDISKLRKTLNNTSRAIDEQVVFDIPGYGNHVLNIYPKEIRSDDYTIRVATESGTIDIPRGANKTFAGFDVNTSKELRLTIDDHFISGFINVNNDILYVEPAWYYLPNAHEDDIVVYYASKAVVQPDKVCGGNKYHPSIAPHEEEGKTKTIYQSRMACKQVQIALANDWLMFDEYGSVTNVENQNLSVINNVETNYDDEFADDLQFSITQIFVSSCSSCDPWSSSENINTVLDDFTGWGPSGFSNTHDIATLWSPRDFFDPQVGNGVIGLAWIGVVCFNFRYNVCEDFTNNANFLRVLQAHEMGHNFDAGHDAGNSTIMAASVSNTDTWSSNSQNDINDFIAAISCLGPCVSGEPPVANFSADQDMGCAPFEVFFNDNSLGEPTEWAWVFEGGTPSTSDEQNPFVTYQNAGSFDVILTVTNSFGTDDFVMTELIVVAPHPEADFLYTIDGLNVDFENASLEYDALSWDFGDGFNSNQENPFHIYDEDGVYTVILTVENECGIDTYTEFVEIVTPPLPDFAASPLSGCEPLQVQFQNFSSTNAVDFFWSFEGGNPSSSALENPTVFYNNSGTFEVSLTAFNSAGENELTLTNYITVEPLPFADFTINPMGLSVEFVAATGNNDVYIWDFGDGNSSMLASPVNDYSEPGTYTIMLITLNDCGTDTTSQNLTIEGAPSAGFSIEMTNLCAPATVQFTNMTTGSPTAFSWTFPGGDPASSVVQNPVVVYSTAGAFDVQLIASNNIGSDTLNFTQFINVQQAPEADFSFVTDEFQSTFFNNSIVATTYNWDFGDGNDSELEDPVHQYEADGFYLVTLIATGPCGSDTITSQVQISTLPSAGFTSQIMEGCEPLLVSFQNQSSPNATAFQWTFEGGLPNTSSLANPIIMYNEPGIYDVSLIATSLAGTDEIVLTDYITVLPDPDANFEINGVDGLDLNFMNTSENASSFLWFFGDGTTSTDENPMHSYDAFGEYSIMLIATNNCGSDTTIQSVQLSTAPFVQFSAGETQGCVPFVVSFTDQSLNNPIEWLWSFPGAVPSSSDLQNPIVQYSSPGVYSVSLTASNASGSTQLALDNYIFVETIPTAEFSFTQNGAELIFNDISSGSTQIQWDFGNGTGGDNELEVVLYETSGEYEVQLIAFNDCGSDTAFQTIFVDLTGIDVLGEGTVRIFPNPSRGKVVLSINELQASEIEWRILSMLGQTMDAGKTLLIDGSAIIESGSSSWPAATYYVVLTAKTERFIQKIVIQR